MRAKRATAGAVVLTLVLLLAVVAAPAVWFRALDEEILAGPVERVRAAGRLSPEGEDLYLVRTLHERADGLRQQGATVGYVQQADAAEGQSRALLALDDMAKAGAIPAQLRSLLQGQLAQQGAEWRYSLDSAGFEQVQCLLPAGPFAYFGVELEPRTRWVVRLWLHLAPRQQAPGALAEMDPAESLAAYQRWLGLDALDDWTPPPLPVYAAQLLSQKGLLQAYADTTTGLAMGVAVLGGEA